LFCQNYMDAKLVCQTVGVALISLNWRVFPFLVLFPFTERISPWGAVEPGN
jgi:hypothetical protein